MRKFPVAASAVMLVGAILAAGALMRRDVESSAERVARSGVIRIGYAWEPPFAFRDEQGRVTGESPEVARAVLERMGVARTEWVQTDFGNLITELRAGRFDMIAAGMFITGERDKLIDFSSPSACIEPALLVRTGNPLDLHSLQEMAVHNRVRLAVLTGAVEAAEARAAGMPADRIDAFADADLAIAAMERGLVDALALSGPTVQRLADAKPGFERAAPFRGSRAISGCAGYGFRHGDEDLVRRFEQNLRAFVGSEAHLKMVGPFGFTRANLPTPERVAEAAR